MLAFFPALRSFHVMLKILKLLKVILISGAVGLNAFAKPVAIDGFAASVNGEMIMVGDVLQYIAPAQKQLRNLPKNKETQAKLEELFNEGLNALVEKKLILAEFDASGAILPKRIVYDRVESVILRSFDGNRAAFLDALKLEGVTLDEWTEKIRENMVLEIMRNQKVFSKVAISPRTVRELYEQQKDQFTGEEQVELQMIILQVPEDDSERETALNKAAKLRARSVAGDDFSELAKEFSQGPKAEAGGYFGWLKMEELKPEVREAIRRREKGEITELLDTGEQFYIVKYLDHREAGSVDFEVVEDQLRRTIKIKKEEELYQAWMKRLRRNFPVKIYKN